MAKLPERKILEFISPGQAVDLTPFDRFEKMVDRRPPITASEFRAERLVEAIGQRIVEAKDHYQALGLSRAAKSDEIRDTVLLYLSTFHPDVYKKAEAEAITRRLVEIRNELMDEKRRNLYDLRLGVPKPPTVQVAVGQPVVYCTNCQSRGRGLVMMEYKKTLGPYKSTGRTYDIYVCPDPTCGKERVGNFLRGVFLGFGK